MPPKVIEDLESRPDPEASDSFALAGNESGTDSVLSIQSGPQISGTFARSKPRKISVVWRLLTSMVLIFGPLLVTWIVIGDKLGLPDFHEMIGSAQGNPTQPTPTEQKNVSTVAQKDVPKLLSPSVEIVGGQFLVDQVLDRQTSKPMGLKTMVDVEVKNLTRCDIVNMAFKLNCTKGDGKTATFEIDQVNFSRGLMPEASGVLSLACEPGTWENVEVSIVSVESENETNLTVIGPHVIRSDDRLEGK